MKRTVFIMAKRPERGRTKTRLCPPLSPEQAAALYACFLQDVLDLVRQVAAQDGTIQGAIAHAPCDAAGYFAQLAPDFARFCQVGQELGERLDRALADRLHQGFGQVVAMNSDSPTLPAAYVAQAFRLLDDAATDVVLGPCTDGGYYLIGVKAHHPRLVREVQMSTPFVLRDTLAVAAAEGLRVHLLPEWYDVDSSDELARLVEQVAALPKGTAVHTRRFLAESPELLCV